MQVLPPASCRMHRKDLPGGGLRAKGGDRAIRALLSRPVPQVQVVPSLLYADDVQPGRCFGKKLCACDKPRAYRWHVSAGHLRGYGEEELVDAAVRHEPAKQGRAAFK